MNGVEVSIRVLKGTSIQTACDSAKEISERVGQIIVFEFNNVKITTHNMSINEMVASYNKQRV